MKKDIDSLKDIQVLVDLFYARVQEDPLLGPIFNSVLSGRWEMHHRKLYRFWHTVLLRRPDYFGNPVPLHFSLNLNEVHFAAWLSIWNKTVDDHFEGKVAERAKFRGKTMAASFISHIKKEAGQ
jgi:hemoglobin